MVKHITDDRFDAQAEQLIRSVSRHSRYAFALPQPQIRHADTVIAAADDQAGQG